MRRASRDGLMPQTMMSVYKKLTELAPAKPVIKARPGRVVHEAVSKQIAKLR